MRGRLAQTLILPLLLATVSGVAGAVVFTPDAVVSDRQVELHWKPEQDDPVYTGGFSLYQRGEQVFGEGDLPLTEELPFISRTNTPGVLWYWDVREQTFVSLSQSGDTWVGVDTVFAMPSEAEGVEVTAYGIHPSGSLLLAGLADGRVVAWENGLEKSVAVHEAHESGTACLDLAFKPLATSASREFLSVGEDGTWRLWDAPGQLQAAAFPDTENVVALRTAKFGRAGVRFALGSEDGHVITYATSDLENPRRILEMESGQSVLGLSFSDDERRLASVDADGVIDIWDFSSGSLRGVATPETPEEIHIAYTPLDSPYLIYARADGEVGVLDGFTARKLSSYEQLDQTILSFALSADGSIGYFGGETGLFEWWYLGACVPSEATPECFGGYLLFRGRYPTTKQDLDEDPTAEKLELLRIFSVSDSTWGWGSNDSFRVFVDPDSIISGGYGLDSTRTVAGPHNGIPYYYALQKFYWERGQGTPERSPRNSWYDGFYRAEGESEPTPLIPRVDPVSTLPLLDDVFVVPNPYVADRENSHFGPLSEPLVRFVNLPERATVRIFTISGDLVRILHHFQTSGGESGGSAPWDLRNDDGRRATSGVYLYSVDTPSGERTQGFFTIVR